MTLKISCARNLAIATLASIMLAGCFEDDPQASEPTRSVEWFQENPAERDAMLRECWNNPGELQGTPNCANAEQASRLDSSGSLREIDLPPLRFGTHAQGNGD